MKTYDFVQMSLLAMGGTIEGKTKLQKTVYLLGVLTDCSEELGYRAYFYGPYSGEVATAIDRLRALGFVDQRVASGGAYDAAGFEVARYDYQLNEQGERAAEAKKKQYLQQWEILSAAADRLNSAGEIGYMKLSIAAKTHFMLGQEQRPATEQELAALASRFGWGVTADQVAEAAKYLEKLGLVEIVATN